MKLYNSAVYLMRKPFTVKGVQSMNKQSLAEARQEVLYTLQKKIIPFWLKRSIDQEYGGYLTSFNQEGMWGGNDAKYLVTQSRMLWGFSQLSIFAEDRQKEEMKYAADQGFHFIVRHFWDTKYGGFFWQVHRDGTVADSSKLTYGESFAIYALSEYALRYQNQEALDYAEKTFELLQLYAADTKYGGYYENLEADWSVSQGGAWAGDRKSLDIHMHLMEAFTTLYEATGKEIHRRKLEESIGLILDHMVNTEIGYGYNQFDLQFRKLPAINIMRTWNAERETNKTIDIPTDTTSYGHNVELSWLLDHAYKIMGGEAEDPALLQKLLDHSLQYGYDYQYGGVYRDGIADKEVLVTDKEWWQNFESLVGYLNGYVKYRDEKYWKAFIMTWEFVKNKFMNMEVGESRQLLDRSGQPIVSNMGNPWKGIYHTGRALGECVKRFHVLMQ